MVFFPMGHVFSEEAAEAMLIQNMENIDGLPKNFRTTNDSLRKNATPPSVQGLSQLHASASGQFSQKGLQAILKAVNQPSPFYIVDLREESHGFMNGIAVSWYAYRDWGNKDKPVEKIAQEQDALLNAALNKEVLLQKVISKTGTGYIKSTRRIKVFVESVATEGELVDAMGLNYVWMPVTDHLKPSSQVVDQFIAFVRSLPPNAWVHFHCAGGVGRSTSFLAMYDMMHNAKKNSLSDILTRQWLLGGYRFQRTFNFTGWKDEFAVVRLDFMKNFYSYCRDNQDNFKESWSSYLKKI